MRTCVERRSGWPLLIQGCGLDGRRFTWLEPCALLESRRNGTRINKVRLGHCSVAAQQSTRRLPWIPQRRQCGTGTGKAMARQRQRQSQSNDEAPGLDNRAARPKFLRCAVDLHGTYKRAASTNAPSAPPEVSLQNCRYDGLPFPPRGFCCNLESDPTIGTQDWWTEVLTCSWQVGRALKVGNEGSGCTLVTFNVKLITLPHRDPWIAACSDAFPAR